MTDPTPLRVFVVAGEPSGDVLGAAVVGALRAMGVHLELMGVGGPALEGEGLQSLFPMTDIAVMGLGPVLRRLPLILRRMSMTVAAARAARPDVLLLIDSPDFCHRVGARVRRADPSIKTVAYVSPTVWAWRPGRAAKMARWCDRLLALLPFEPEAHHRLHGPPTTYVGHPLMGRLDRLRPTAVPRSVPVGRPPRLLILPGSRQSEVSRLIAPFGETLARLSAKVGPIEATIPAVPHVRAAIEAAVATWPVKATIVTGEAAKEAAFRAADLALAASGTVTLELALAGIPTVAAYKLDALARRVVPFLKVPKPLAGLIDVRTPILPNLIVNRVAIPALIDAEVTPEALAVGLARLLADTPERRAQLQLFADVEAAMTLADGLDPARAAAQAVLEVAAGQRRILARR